MLMTIAIVLLVLWLLGLVTGTTLGGFIYVLLVIAVVLFIVQVITGRRFTSLSKRWRYLDGDRCAGYRCRTPNTAIFVLWSNGAGSTGGVPTRVAG